MAAQFSKKTALGVLILLLGFISIFVSPRQMYNAILKLFRSFFVLFSSSPAASTSSTNAVVQPPASNMAANGAVAMRPSASINHGAAAASLLQQKMAKQQEAQLAQLLKTKKGLFKVSLSLSCILKQTITTSQNKKTTIDIEFTSPEAKQLLYHLAVERANIDLYLLAVVESDLHEQAIQLFLQQECDGVLQPLNNTNANASDVATNSRFVGVNPFKLLYCETLVGKQAIVRQLEPLVHIESEHLVVEHLQRFIPNLVLLSKDGLAKQHDNIVHIETSQHVLALLLDAKS